MHAWFGCERDSSVRDSDATMRNRPRRAKTIGVYCHHMCDSAPGDPGAHFLLGQALEFIVDDPLDALGRLVIVFRDERVQLLALEIQYFIAIVPGDVENPAVAVFAAEAKILLWERLG